MMRRTIIFQSIAAVVALALLMSCGGKVSSSTDGETTTEAEGEVILEAEGVDTLEAEGYVDGDADGEDKEFYFDGEFFLSFRDMLSLFNTYDEPENIRKYIDEIIADGKYLTFYRDYDDSRAALVVRIRQVADMLQKYRDGKSKHYPVKEVFDVVGSMLFEVAYVDNHGGTINPREAIIIPRLLDIAASLAPDIYKIAEHCSADGKLGIMTVKSGYNNQYDFMALVTKGENGYIIRHLPDCFAKLNKVRKVGDSEHSTQYVLSFEDADSYPYLLPQMLVADLYENGMMYITNLTESRAYGAWNSYLWSSDRVDNMKIYFNPNDLSWSWCVENKYGNLERVEGTSVLYLDLEMLSLSLK